MARYIDADALIKNIVEIEDLRTLSTKTIGEAIDKTPTADVEEVRHSKWVVSAYDNQGNLLVIDYIKHQHSSPYCFRCKGDALLDGAEEYVTSDYCPHCGAIMDGGKAE